MKVFLPPVEELLGEELAPAEVERLECGAQYPQIDLDGESRRGIQQRRLMASRVLSKASLAEREAEEPGPCMRRRCWVKRSLRLKSLWDQSEDEEDPVVGLGPLILAWDDIVAE